MKPFVDRQTKYINLQKAARQERAAEERNFMENFNPNKAKREDFTRFREGLKKQAAEAVGARFNPSGSIGIMGSANAEKFRKLYDEPYRALMNQYMMTNPESYKSHFPKTYGFVRGMPNIMKGILGAASGIPMLGAMLPEPKPNKLLGDFSYLDYRPTRLGTPKGEVMREAYTSAGGFEYPEVVSTGAMEDYYDEYFPMQLPDYFYQFMDDEMLPYILGMR
jgi:hypothetical protein